MTHDEAMKKEFNLTLTGKDISTILYALERCAAKLQRRIVNIDETSDSKTEGLFCYCISLSHKLERQYIKELEESKVIND